MLEFLQRHRVTDVLVLYWTISAFISALPSPEKFNSAFYDFIYKFVHTLAGNLMTVFGDKIRTLTGQAALIPQNGQTTLAGLAGQAQSADKSEKKEI